jgi:D-threo-aldose 1-dehydrogenase
VQVTELGFGGSGIGNLNASITDSLAYATVDAAWEAGIRYFDTAPHYGLGLSEHRLGRMLSVFPRDGFVLSTKVGRILETNPSPTGSDLAFGGFAVPDTLVRRFDFTADGVKRSLEGSISRLGVSRIDIALVHDPDDYVDQAISEAIPALIDLREQGIVSAVGAGMTQSQALLRMVREHPVDVVMVAGRWTLLDRSGRELLDACAERGVSVLVAAPFNSGLLASPWPQDGARYDYEPASADLLVQARCLAKRCDEYGITLPQAALHFPLRHPAVVSVVVGLQTPQQVRADVAWFAATVPAEFWAGLH